MAVEPPVNGMNPTMNHPATTSSWRTPVLATLLLLLAAPQLSAQSTLTARIVGHVSPENVKVFEVGDVPDHTITVAQPRGLAFLDSGDVAELRATETLESEGGEGTYRGYEVLTFEDGSTIVSEFEGEDRMSENGRHIDFQGTYRHIRGTGRFAGIEGSGTQEGRSYVASGAGFYVDVEGTYTLPSDR